jgi:glucose-6-phosphate-specific signal transduction histidine kinase
MSTSGSTEPHWNQWFAQLLHNNLCQQLTGVMFLVQVLERKLDRAQREEATDVARVADLMGDCAQTLRALIKDLAEEPPVAAGALLPMLQGVVEDYHAAEFPITTSLEDPKLDAEGSWLVFRAVSESLMWAKQMRRATASRLFLSTQGLRMEFETKEKPRPLTISVDPYLPVLDARAKLLGGILSAERGPGGEITLNLGFLKNRADHRQGR